MGIFVEETAAFIMGGFISAAVIYTKIDRKAIDGFLLILFVFFMVLGAIGLLDVAIDHLIDDTAGPQQATP